MVRNHREVETERERGRIEEGFVWGSGTDGGDGERALLTYAAPCSPASRRPVPVAAPALRAGLARDFPPQHENSGAEECLGGETEVDFEIWGGGRKDF